MNFNLRAASALLLCASGIAHGAVTYTVADLGPFAGQFSAGLAINDVGWTTVLATNEDGESRAYLFDGQSYKLPTPDVVSSQGVAINNLGHVAGFYTSYGGIDEMSFVYRSGRLETLGNLQGPVGHIAGINDQGQLAGTVMDGATQRTKAVLYRDGQATNLGTLGGASSQAQAINGKGQIAGFSEVADPEGAVHAFVYDNGTMKDLGTLDPEDPYAVSQAFSLNDKGDVVGWSGSFSLRPHAFLYSGGTMKDLGALDAYQSRATGVNDRGDVIGTLSYFDAEAATQTDTPFLYSGGQMQKLQGLIDPGSGWELRFATGINEGRQIVGAGVFNGVERGFVLTPVPEASTTAMSVLGVLMLVGMRLRTRTP